MDQEYLKMIATCFAAADRGCESCANDCLHEFMFQVSEEDYLFVKEELKKIFEDRKRVSEESYAKYLKDNPSNINNQSKEFVGGFINILVGTELNNKDNLKGGNKKC